MAKTAILIDRTTRELHFTRSGGGATTSVLRDGTRRYYSKPANKVSPLIDGWRKPTSWVMTDHLYDRTCVGTYSYVHSSGTPVVMWGRLPFGINKLVTEAPLALPPRLRGQCEIQALNKMRENAVNLGVAFGERREAASMIRDRAVTMVRAVRELRKGNLRSFRQALGLRPGAARNATSRRQAAEIAGQVPQLWLEHQYGWKPLLNDVHTAIDRYADNNYRDPTRLYASVKNRLKMNQESFRKFVIQDGIVAEVVDEVSHEGFVRIDYKPDEYYSHLKGPEEWGILNPLVVAWELVPFSFVADWFIPVGDWLSAVTAAAPYSFKDGSFSWFRKFKSELVVKVVGDAPHAKNQLVDARAGASGTSLIREVYNGFPIPRMSALGPHVSDASQQSIFTRAANALSILATTFKG